MGPIPMTGALMRKSGHRHIQREEDYAKTQEMMAVHKSRRETSEETNPSWAQTSSFQIVAEHNFCCLRHPLCGVFYCGSSSTLVLHLRIQRIRVGMKLAEFSGLEILGTHISYRVPGESDLKLLLLTLETSHRHTDL